MVYNLSRYSILSRIGILTTDNCILKLISFKMGKHQIFNKKFLNKYDV